MLSTRRTAIVSVGAASVACSVLLTAPALSVFPVGQAIINLAVGPLALVMVWMRRRDVSAWLAIVTLLLLALGTGFADPGSDARLFASLLLLLLAYYGVLMLGRRWQLPWIAFIAVVWWPLVTTVPMPLVIDGSVFNMRWVTLLQLVGSSLWLARVWNRELDSIRERDAAAAAVEQHALASVALRERIRVWRSSLVRIHETVLNDIRSVLDSGNVGGLPQRANFSHAHHTPPPSAGASTLIELLTSIASTDVRRNELLLGPLPDVTLDAERSAALRSVIIELVRNLFRHTHSSRVTVSGDALAGRLSLHIQPDVTPTVPASSRAGIGTGLILTDVLESLRARVSVQGAQLTLRLPISADARIRDVLRESNSGRVIISTIAASSALAGIGIYVSAALAFGGQGIALAVAATAASLIATVPTWRRRHLNPANIVMLTAIASLVPLLAAPLVQRCLGVELLMLGPTLSSIGFVGAIVWAPSLRWWWLALAPTASMLHLARVATTSCTAGVTPPLLSILVAPMSLGIVFFTMRRSAVRAGRMRVLQEREVREESAAQAAQALGAALHSAVERAEVLMAHAAGVGHLDDEARRDLRCLDAEIRANIQFDPELGGAMVGAVRYCVGELSHAGIPVRVLALRDNADRRPLPDGVLKLLRSILHASVEGHAEVQVLASAGEETLIVTTTHAAAQRAGLPAGWSTVIDDVNIDLEDSEADSPVTLFMRRERPRP